MGGAVKHRCGAREGERRIPCRARPANPLATGVATQVMGKAPPSDRPWWLADRSHCFISWFVAMDCSECVCATCAAEATLTPSS